MDCVFSVEPALTPSFPFQVACLMFIREKKKGTLEHHLSQCHNASVHETRPSNRNWMGFDLMRISACSLVAVKLVRVWP